MLRNKTELDLV